MYSTIFQSNRPQFSTTDPNDLLNLLRDENFPQYPPFTQNSNKSPHKKKRSHGAIKFSDSLSESLFLSQVNHVSDQPQKQQKKKKRVVFREEIADYCSTSPQRIMPDDMKVMLSKAAKKGILTKKHSISIYDILWDKNPNEEQDNYGYEIQKNDNEVNTSDINVGTIEEQTESKNDKIVPLNIPLETIDLENEPLDISSSSSVDDEARSKAFAGSTPKASSKKGLNKPQDNPLTTPFSTNLEKGISLSEVMPTAFVPDLRKNQSSIAGSLNDLPESIANSMAGSETSLNEIDLKLRATSQHDSEVQKPSPRVRIVKYRESPSLSVEISNGISEKLMTKGANKSGLSSFAPSQTFLNDLKVQNRPLINTKNSLTVALTKGIMNQSIKKPDNLKSLNHHSGKAFSMNNLETKKIQTAANNHILIKTNTTPKARSKAYIPLEIPQRLAEIPTIQSDRELTNKTTSNISILSNGNNILSQEKTNHMNETFCLKDGNKVIWYSLKDKNYKVKELDQSLGLEGCAFCQVDDESILITGGIESKNPSSKLVSSKVSLLNINGEKETLQGMPIARYNHSLVALGKNVYTVGGQSFDGKVLKSCYMFDIEKNSWFRIPSMKYERINPVTFASIKTGSIYVVGGTNAEGDEIPWIEKFDHKKGSWQLVYNTSRLNFNTKESTIVLGTIRNCEKENNSSSEEVLMLVKNNIVKNGLCNYSLFSFDTEKEILQKKSNFQYEVSEFQVMGFLYKENLYLAEKDCYTIMDVYFMNKQTWNQIKFAQNN